MRMDGAPVSTERNAVMGTYPARNGRWSYLHCNFPNHRAAALRVLGVPEDREAVRKAVAEWDALELEEAIIAARGADRKSTRLNSSHQIISYAVFCLKKKKPIRPNVHPHYPVSCRSYERSPSRH